MSHQSCVVALQMRLSDTASVAIKMPLTGRDGQPIQAVLTQQDFERLSADLFRRARLPLDEACWQVSPLLDGAAIPHISQGPTLCSAAICLKISCDVSHCSLLCAGSWDAAQVQANSS